MSKTNDHARAARAVGAYILQGASNPTVLKALQDRLAGYDAAYAARKAAEALSALSQSRLAAAAAARAAAYQASKPIAHRQAA